MNEYIEDKKEMEAITKGMDLLPMLYNVLEKGKMLRQGVCVYTPGGQRKQP